MGTTAYPLDMTDFPCPHRAYQTEITSNALAADHLPSWLLIQNRFLEVGRWVFAKLKSAGFDFTPEHFFISPPYGGTRLYCFWHDTIPGWWHRDSFLPPHIQDMA